MTRILPATAFALLLSSAAWAQFAPQQAGTAPLEPALESRVQKLGAEIRCPTCQGLSIAASSAATARAQLDMVRTLVTQGKSDEEIKQFFVDRYGEWALLKPSSNGLNSLVWIGPVALLVGGFGFVLLYAAKHKQGAVSPEAAAAPAAAAPGPDAPAGEDPYLSAVRAELDR
ncbi:MAG: cytochrome c-type biogenesis protein [Myxococcaceae bacterium]